MSHGLQADAHYTWSRTRDMATHSNGGGQTMDNYDIWRDYGPANWDIPHRFVASYIYDVPFLKDSPNPILKYVVAGWQISGVTTHPERHRRSTSRFGGDRANIGISGLQRPNLVGAVPIAQLPAESGEPAAADQLLRRGRRSRCRRSSRSATRRATCCAGRSSSITDLSLMKNVPLGGGAPFQIRAEMFNVFNTVN